MSSTESSGAPAEATATTPASNAPSSFGSTRGSGLLRGKVKRSSAPAAATAASSDYTPTAIAVVSAPREYQNPFAPVETPAAVTPEPVAAPATTVSVTPVVENPVALAKPDPVAETAPAAVHPESVAAPATDEQAELHILEPEQQKTAPAQTWESEGFRPAREPRGDRPRREEPRREERSERAPREESAPFDPATIPAKFLYVRPGYNYVPTPSNYGGAPRSREGGPAVAPSSAAPTAAAPQKSGGFLGWLKSLFGGSAAAPAAVEASPGEFRNGDRHRGGRGRGPGGDGQRRRNRGGRGRSQYRGDNRGGGQGSPSAT